MIERCRLPLRRAPELDEGEIHIWHLQPDRLAPPGFDRRVDARERARQRRMQQKFILRLLLAAYLGCQGRDVNIDRTRAGRPKLAADHAEAGLDFNLSHSGAHLAVAIARGLKPGIDIEAEDRPLRHLALARRWFSQAEAGRLQGLEDALARRTFLHHWTAREAMIKAMGQTIAARLGEIALDPQNPRRPIALPTTWPGPEQWHLEHLRSPTGLVTCLALPGKPAAVRQFELVAE